MKQSFLLMTMITLMSSAFTNRLQAAAINFQKPSHLSEYAAYAPDFPDIPQDDDFLCADVNENGLINVLDIIALVNYIMGGNPSPFNEDAADITADDNINVLDIIALVNIIMQVPGQPCGCVAPVLYEGETYTTVQIGEQCWFKENLNVGIKINSTSGGYQQTSNGITEKYCYFNDITYCNIYGGLYEWPEAMQYVTSEGAQGICPVGWHIPTDNEWKILEGTVDSQYPVGDPEWDIVGWRGLNAGGNLKETGITHWNPPNTGATNESGFTNLAGGCRGHSNGNLYDLGSTSSNWTSSQNNSGYAWGRKMFFQGTEIGRYSYSQDDGFSIRCLKGCWPQPTPSNAGPDQLNVSGTFTTLAGNTPTYGTGLWAIVSGTGGTIVNPTSPTSEFQGLAANEYLLSWTITTACESSEDQVLISLAAGFTCGSTLVDDRDGQSYTTILIGTQCWMAKNLNVGSKINSTTGGYQQIDNGIIEKYCYNNDLSQCDIYGGLYEWPEAMQYITTAGAQGICPTDWHIPTDNEWKILEGAVDSQYPVGDPVWENNGWRGSDAGGKLKESGIAHWNNPNVGATNESGFTALPGGHRYFDDGMFYNRNYFGDFWTSSESNTLSAWFRELWYGEPRINRTDGRKADGFPIRCIQDY